MLSKLHVIGMVKNSCTIVYNNFKFLLLCIRMQNSNFSYLKYCIKKGNSGKKKGNIEFILFNCLCTSVLKIQNFQIRT